MAVETTIGPGKPGVADFQSETFGGPAEARYGDTDATTTTISLTASGADLYSWTPVANLDTTAGDSVTFVGTDTQLERQWVDHLQISYRGIAAGKLRRHVVRERISTSKCVAPGIRFRRCALSLQ